LQHLAGDGRQIAGGTVENFTARSDRSPQFIGKVAQRCDPRRQSRQMLQLRPPDQGATAFLRRARTHQLFTEMLAEPKKDWKFNQSPLFLRFLMGKHDYECTPWGNPTFNMFGWQRPCYLLQEGYASTFQELMDTTEWEGYGRKSGNEKCRDCMVHCGYEPTAVDQTFSSLKAFRETVTVTLTGRL